MNVRLRVIVEPLRPLDAVGIDGFVDKVATLLGEDPAGIRSRDRTRNVTEARHLAQHFLLTHSSLTQTDIGEWFGQDRSTISEASKTIKNLLSVSNESVVEKHYLIFNWIKSLQHEQEN